MSTRKYDFLIIGAGIVGLSVAYELKKRFPQALIGVLEKESSEGLHASGRNSGVLHSGVYYSNDTLKARVCATGAARMRSFAAENSIPCLTSGKVIVATSESELATLYSILNNANANGIRAFSIDEKQLREIEPYATAGIAAIYTPDTAVIDNKLVLKRLVNLLEMSGVNFYWSHKLSHVLNNGEVVCSSEQFSYGHLFNCAGAYADSVAKKFDLAKDYALIPFKGIYWKLRPESQHLVRSNIYPVPDISLPFLGVHLTRSINGDVYIGPTAIPVLGRENYSILQGICPLEAVGIGLRLALMYLDNSQNFRKLAHMEISKYSKSNFVKAGQKLLPSMKAADMVATPKSGIRPQLYNLKTGRLEMDFILNHTDNSTHVLNAISPAFTSAFAFAEMIVDSSHL